MAFKGGVEGYGDARWQVERLAQMGAPAADEALTGALAGVAGDRREAGEAGSKRCSMVPGSGISTSTAHAVASATPGMLTRMGVDRGDLALDLAEALPGLMLEQRRAVGVVAVARGDAALDQGAAGAVQLLHGVEGRAHDRP